MSTDTQFVDDPLVSGSGQFALAAPASLVARADAPSVDGLRPWGLRRMGPVLRPSARRAGWRFDHERQVGVDAHGVPVLSLRKETAAATTTGSPGSDDPTDEDWQPDATEEVMLAAGPPTAPTTPPVDGEDPPSAEDWNNDYCPDEPVLP